MILHYELPYKSIVGMGWIRVFCGKSVTKNLLAENQESITCEKCKEELKKYNESGQNI